jgi:hypothetical protein
MKKNNVEKNVSVSVSSRGIRNTQTEYMVNVNPNSVHGAMFGVVGVKLNGAGFEGAVISADNQYALQEFDSLYKTDIQGNPVIGENGKPEFAYQPMPIPDGYGFTSGTVFATRVTLCLHYQKMSAGNANTSRLVQVYVPDTVAPKLWRAISFANGKSDALLSEKQLEAYDAGDAEALTAELEAFVQTFNAIKSFGVAVGVKAYSELDFTQMKTQPENFGRFNGTKATFVGGKATLEDGTVLEASYSINGVRELAVRQNPFANGTELVALKDARFSKELQAGIAMRSMLRMIMPTKQNIMVDFYRDMTKREAEEQTA